MRGGDADIPSRNDRNSEGGPGVFYRPLLPWQIVINDARAAAAVYSGIVLLPNYAPILSLVARKTSMVFQNGSPVAFALDRQSPAAAWAALPLDMTKSFLSVPAEMLQLKFNFARTNAALTAAEAVSLKNRLELLQQQVDLQNFARTNQMGRLP